MRQKQEVLGIIGCPIGHTLSPVIHAAFGKHAGKDLAYVPFEVERERLGDAVRGAYALGIRGLNVTVPHKCDVIPYLCAVDPLAGKIGAVNTLVREKDGFKGYNTDVTGLGRALKEAGIDLAGARVVILGAGGAGRAVACLCASEGAAETAVINRSYEKAQALCEEVCAAFQTDAVYACTMEEFLEKRVPGEGRVQYEGGGVPSGEGHTCSPDKYIAIQCTSVGLAPHDNESVTEDPAFFARLSHAVDIVYRPLRTRFLTLAEEAGVPTLGGLSMLVWQAADAFALWYPDAGLTPEVVRGAYAVAEVNLTGHSTAGGEYRIGGTD